MINGYMYNSDSVAEYVYSARRSGIKVLGPDVNRSRPKFSVENGCIRFGLAAVKNVGEGVMEELVKEREAHGPFKDFWDFCDRAPGLNKRMVENMIYAGCFDSMGYTRTQLLKVYDQAMELSAKTRKNRDAGQMSLFDFDDGDASVSSHPPILPSAEMPHKLLLQKEREATGLYLSGHPLDDYMDVLSGLSVSVMDLAEADGTTLEESDSTGSRIYSFFDAPSKSVISSISREFTRSSRMFSRPFTSTGASSWKYRPQSCSVLGKITVSTVPVTPSRLA